MTSYLNDSETESRVSRCFPSPVDVGGLGKHYDVIPVYQELLADTVTPVTLFAHLCGPQEPGFLLESVPVSGDAARYSYIGYQPRLTIPEPDDPLGMLRGLVEQEIAPVPGLPPFHGGAVGYLAYESARHFERLPVAEGTAPGLPEAAFLAADDLVVFDHARRRLLLVTLHRPAQETYADAVARIDNMHDSLAAPMLSDGAGSVSDDELVADVHDVTDWQSNVSQAEYEQRVQRAREYIAAGDAFQIVLSQRFSKPLRADPLNLYRQLRATNPSPYMYHVNLGGSRHIIGASPELLVKTDGARVETRPLAGTRRRCADPDDDVALEQELLADEKERAEHVMLVDLGRNDLGKVAKPGSINVDKFMEVERFSHVMHLSSTVSGELSGSTTVLDALRAAFPAGTLSGAPKIRAMEIIAELETQCRGLYGGALGHIGFGGVADLAIGLRTLVVADGAVHVQAGAGVVADSDPTAEYWETLHKASALFTAVRRAEAMS